MYLKELDLQGFKSFPEKVRLEFNKGITAVVGPNGSGKSNISDAVRWVLGEQRAKSLRGGKMEDVIFAGTANRKPVGFAEVSMTVDNSDKKIPVDYTEIKITRRVYRSGESSYSINGVECRLKDIYELFMDTGIGRDGYSIIGQGKIDEILSNKSEDRRRLFEEAAGIVKYKNRRTEAETKLEREQQNLIRITDIISEIESKIGPLEKQAEKAKKYLELYAQLKEADIQLFRINGQKLESEVSKTEELVKSVNENIALNENNLEKFKADSESIKEQTERLNSDTEELNRMLTELAAEIEKNEGISLLTHEQIKNLEETVLRLNTEKNEAAEKTAAALAETEKYRAQIININNETELLNSQLSEKENFLGIMLNKENEHEKKIEEIKSDVIEKIRISADLKSNCERIKLMLEQFESRKSRIDSDRAENTERLDEIKKRFSELNEKSEQAEEDILELRKELDRNEAKQQSIKNTIETLRKSFEEKNKSLTEKQSRLRVLTDMEREHDGYYKSVKAVLQLKDNGDKAFGGVHGAVAELLKTDAKYETAIETALSGSMQSIVVNNENDAKTAVNYLKSRQLGRATFLPIATVKGRTFGNEKDSILREKGVVAAASDLVKYDEKYKGIVESLLGRIVVMDNMDNAIVFARKYKQSHRIVTLEGDVFMPGGAITGGSSGRKGSSVFSRKREMDGIKSEIDALMTACKNLRAEGGQRSQELKKLAERANELKEEINEINISKITALKELESVNNSVKELEYRIKLIDIEKTQLTEQNDSAKNDFDNAQKELGELESTIAETEKMLDNFRHSAEDSKSGRTSLSDEITALKVKLSSIEAQKKGFEESISRINAENKKLIETTKNADGAIENALAEKAEKEKMLAETAEKTEKLREQKTEKDGTLAETLESRRGAAQKLETIEKNVENCRETILKYKNELVRLETKSEKLEEDKKRLFDSMWDNYEITYPEVLKYPETDASAGELSKNASELRGSIRTLGTVNVNAVEEYTETRDRYEFLTKQKEDIIQAEEKLKTIIKDLSSLMEKQFREKLEIISDNFNDVFREMFGGGQAYLKLAEEDNVLDSGIDIIAQPPGKTLQSMMLLSGGERALTAIAILFSILKMKPSPFCILDEIEAALDDANVLRFGDYLQRFSNETQFIVITHRKGTMEAADVLYGVTMQEAGVSKIVSVKFDEAVRDNAI